MPIKFIYPRETNKLLPNEFEWLGRVTPYENPLFGILFRKRLKYILKLVISIYNSKSFKFKKVLEIGFGLGHFSLNLAINLKEINLYGIEIFEERVNNLIKKIFSKFSIKFEVYTQDIQKKSSFSENHFDLIIALDVLEHIIHPKAALEEIERILNNKGILIISVPIESILLKKIKLIYRKIIGKGSNSLYHWIGDISSVKAFDNLIKMRFNVISKQHYPFRYLPPIFSYDYIYILSKKT